MMGEAAAGRAGDILAVNVGSTSLKYALFSDDAAATRRGKVERIAQGGSGLQGALQEMVDDLGDRIAGVRAAAFKVVHGGGLTGTVLLDDQAVAALRRFAVAAPAHNPPYLQAIEHSRAMLPGMPLVGTFETAFHAGWTAEAKAYALPNGWAERFGLRRYGFHGASHRYIAERSAELEPGARRVLSCHLGGSSSICAIVDGRSVDSTMGFSPQSGLPQAERTGDLDAFALAHVVSEGVPIEEAAHALATEAGLLGLSGRSGDLRELEQSEARGDERAAFAMAVYAYQARKAIGALAAAMGGMDAIVFTGGMGENSPRLRERICDGLKFLGVRLDAERNRARRPRDRPGSVHAAGAPVAVWVIPTDEERILVRETLSFLDRPRSLAES
jgi:acetate kinase